MIEGGDSKAPALTRIAYHAIAKETADITSDRRMSARSEFMVDPLPAKLCEAILPMSWDHLNHRGPIFHRNAPFREVSAILSRLPGPF